MNLLHLKYAVEVAKASSISKAAENLYMGQPNLSRAISELEETLGVKIFKRSSKGISTTPQGEEFLGYARKILSQVDAVEKMYNKENIKKQLFSISVPRASYISCAFTEFVKKIDTKDSAEIFYKETNSMRAVDNILNSDFRLGILRFQAPYEDNFKLLLREKGLDYSLITEFVYYVVMSKEHPLANKDFVAEDLEPFIEIAHADSYVPSLPIYEVQKNELSKCVNKRIFVYERGSQMDLLSTVHNTFMWVSPIPKRILDMYGLVQKRCSDQKKIYRDVLIYRKDYTLTDIDRKFISEIDKFKPVL